jgi:hypothetical protein
MVGLISWRIAGYLGPYEIEPFEACQDNTHLVKRRHSHSSGEVSDLPLGWYHFVPEPYTDRYKTYTGRQNVSTRMRPSRAEGTVQPLG